MVASLGVTENDWKALAQASLEGFKLHIAMKAFSRIKDLEHLDLIHEYLVNFVNSEPFYAIYIYYIQLLNLQENQDQSKESFMGDVYAYEGKFKEACKFYQKAGSNHKALAMYTDMRMFDLAQV